MEILQISSLTRTILIEQLVRKSVTGSTPNATYFYCTRNPVEPERSNPEAILRSFVKQVLCLQVLQPSLFQIIQDVYNKKKENGFASGPLSLAESTDLIIQLTGVLPLTTIVIDALDECDRDKRSDLIAALQKILQESQGRINLFVSSRDDQDIVCHFADCLNLEIEATKNHGDIVSFVKNEVERLISIKKLLFGKISTDLKHRIIKELCSGARGMSVLFI